MPVTTKSKRRNTNFRQWLFLGLALSALIGVVLSQKFLLTRKAHAASLFTEDFNYTAGTLLTANGWTAHSGAGTNPLTVVTPGLTYAGYASSGIGNAVAMTTSGEDAHRTFTSQTSGSVYAAFLVNVSAASTSADGDYFFHLGPSPISTIFRARVFAKRDASNNLAFGISKAGSTAAVTSYTGFTYALNTTYLLVAKYTIVAGATNDTAELFINPTPGGSEPAPTLTAPDVTASDAANIGAVAVRQGTAANAPTQQVDGIRVANDWASAVASGLPTLSINDVSQSEGNAGTTNFTFTVSLSSPAQTGGVSFTVNTADGTAQDDNPNTEDNDYVPIVNGAGSIPEGSSSTQVTVVVNGDTTFEPDQTFFVNLTNVTGAGVTDGQGLGTIQNDDACANLSINDVTQAEGNAGTTTFAFTVSLSQAGCGTVTFDIATADGTAQDDNPATEDNDYIAQSLTAQAITFPSTYTFNVTVNGDVISEPDQTFFVNITNVSPANVQVTDSQGLGTIANDDFTLISQIQGSTPSGDAASPKVGEVHTIRGIVTLLKSNGFFLQEEIGDNDADPNTSEAVFVFTSSAPTVAVGHQATVTGTVVEFNGLTEISAPTVTINSTGNTLPTAVTITAADLPTNADRTQPQLEKYEGMRLFAASLTTVAPSNNFFEVYTVITGQPRPMREPGIPAGDPIPPDPTSGTPDCCIPIFDRNPERLLIDTNDRAGSTGEVFTSNVVITNFAGPLDYAFGAYRIISEGTPTRTANMTAVAVPTPSANEFTVAGFNIENFNSATTAGNTQKLKASLGIVRVMKLPDIIGHAEIFNLSSLQALATQVNADAVADGHPNPMYVAQLIPTPVAGITQNVGFLVKTSRVQINSVTQERTSSTYIQPTTGTPDDTHDRPPLVLRATIDPSGLAKPVIVVVNHTRSFNDVELVAGAGLNARAKRKAQAEDLADLFNDLQTDNPGVPVIGVGDYNAFQFNSGYDDPISVMRGSPTADDQIVVDDSPDLVNPNFINLIEDVTATERYSFIFDSTPQVLDQVLVNTFANTLKTRIHIAHMNADFPDSPASAFESNAAIPERNSDHDAPVAYFNVTQADVSLTKSLDTAGPYTAGQSITYTINVANAGPFTATNIQVTDTPTNLTITNVSSTNCSSLPCTIPSLAASANESITVTATIDAPGAFDNSATATAAEPDSNSANNTDNTGNGGTAVGTADVSISKTLDTAGPYTAGQSITYTINVANAGPSTATNIQVTDTPTNLTITTVSSTNCSSLPCTIPSIATSANESITVTATIDASGAFDNSATANAAETDPNSANNTDNTGNNGITGASADVSITKTLDTAGPYNAGQSITYTINVANGGPYTATNINVTDTPTNLTITNVSGACTSFSPCTIPSLASGANTNITVTATIDAAGAFDNSATATATEADPTPGNNTDNTDNGGTAGAALPTLSIDDVTHLEGNSGTTAYVFTVTKTGAGAATVEYTTNNATASTSDNDYQANSNSLSFASGDTTKQITVLVNGDTTPETHEVFSVSLFNPSGATITDNLGVGTINNDDQSVTAGQVIISEFRFRGPGGSPPPPAPLSDLYVKTGTKAIKAPTFVATNQDQDEFIEFYNNSDSDILVTTTDASPGWALAANTGGVRFLIPNGTTIPARGHFLAVNKNGYSLSGYGGFPRGIGDAVMTPDGNTTDPMGYTVEIPDGSGIALFRSATTLTMAERLDAAGYAGVDPLYREGAGFPTGGAELSGGLEYTFFRTMTRATGGRPKDTGDNTADFYLADTLATPGLGMGQRLGAPGPENLFSPINRSDQFPATLLDPGVGSAASPNRERNTAVVPNGDYGTLTVRRTFTNNTGQPVTRLRFRIIEMTTKAVSPGVADLRALTGVDETVTTTLGPVLVRGTNVEEPPFQLMGGGWNTSLNVTTLGGPSIPSSAPAKVDFETPTTGTLALPTPLPNGASVNVSFRLGVMQTGSFVFYIIVEPSHGSVSIERSTSNESKVSQPVLKQ